jgi:hypothetical protein
VCRHLATHAGRASSTRPRRVASSRAEAGADRSRRCEIPPRQRPATGRHEHTTHRQARSLRCEVTHNATAMKLQHTTHATCGVACPPRPSSLRLESRRARAAHRLSHFRSSPTIPVHAVPRTSKPRAGNHSRPAYHVSYPSHCLGSATSDTQTHETSRPPAPPSSAPALSRMATTRFRTLPRPLRKGTLPPSPQIMAHGGIDSPSSQKRKKRRHSSASVAPHSAPMHCLLYQHVSSSYY